MSESVYSVGVMVPITHNLTAAELEQFGEWAWEDAVSIYISYDGSMIYSQDNLEDGEYGINFAGVAKSIAVDAKVLAKFAHTIYQFLRTLPDDKYIAIQMQDAINYSCYWYNGTDSDMSMMTAERFLKLTGQ
jgi:hypothetical protein